MVNGVWSEQWQGDWELMLLVDDRHAGEVLMVLVLVLLACRSQLRGKRKMGVDHDKHPVFFLSEISLASPLTLGSATK